MQGNKTANKLFFFWLILTNAILLTKTNAWPEDADRRSFNGCVCHRMPLVEPQNLILFY